MEVHSHPHTPRRKWTHYFWEFLMLFMAVTAGFFVENLREHYIEHNRAKQYALFLYNDLVKDTANLKKRTEFMVDGVKKMDTLINTLKSDQRGSLTEKIYTLSLYAYSSPFFGATTSTIEQLKSSGSLRYFQNNALVQNFSNHDNDLRNLSKIETANVYLTEQLRIFLAEFLDLKSMPRLVQTDTSSLRMEHPSVPGLLKLFKNDPVTFERYANLCALKQLDWINKINYQNITLNSARKLITSLKKEYRLE